MADETYFIRRFCASSSDPDHRRVIKRGLTLEEAQAHCQREDTSVKDDDGHILWFDGYEREA